MTEASWVPAKNLRRVGGCAVRARAIDPRVGRPLAVFSSETPLHPLLGLSTLLLTLAAPDGQRADASPRPENIARDIERLSTSGAVEAVARLSALRDRAVPLLRQHASSGAPLAARGWAVVALARIEGNASEEALAALSEDERLEDLLRLWADAARVRRAPTLDALLGFAPLLTRQPALTSPLSAQAKALASEGLSTPDVVRLLRAGEADPALQRALFPALARLPAGTLVEVSLTHEEDALRRLAAKHLTSRAARGDAADIADALLARLRLSPSSTSFPWTGGSLVLPVLPRDEGRALFGALLRWYLWAEVRGELRAGRQLHDVMHAIGLSSFAGATLPGWYARSALQWLLVWRDAVGVGAVRELLAEQGLEKDAGFHAALSPPEEP